MDTYSEFDRSRLRLGLCAARGHDLKIEGVLPLLPPVAGFPLSVELDPLIDRISFALQNGRSVILMTGGHPIKLGLSRFFVDLIERGLVTHLATNGAGIIHDFELAALGGTSENVPKWISEGRFGLWRETSQLNEVIAEADHRGEGLGQAVGRVIDEENFPYREVSIAAAGYRCRVPITCHVTIGADIIHAHPNCNGAALGATSYRDFLIFARSVQNLEDGVFLNIGSAVTGPEVFLKALSMARNIAHQDGKEIRRFASAVFDLIQLPENAPNCEPGKDNPLYYFRPWKTLLVRTVKDGGKSFYLCGDHRQTIPALWHLLTSRFPASAQQFTGIEQEERDVP